MLLVIRMPSSLPMWRAVRTKTAIEVLFKTYFVGGTRAAHLLDPSGFILFPLVVHSFYLVVSSAGILSIRSTRESEVKSPTEDPMTILRKSHSVTIFLVVFLEWLFGHGL
uniref:Uncharacterized protein n=1 Tax=Nelumbo nucifera TaxID=4432 RepID=A0A822XIA6_NELNU|nr:TPA_asm: hypothetical protein HUJ06_020334 [Nelumbo nucifera]